MIARRTVVAAVAAGIAGAATLWPAGPAVAHGAPVSPVSRAFACTAGGQGDTAACRAALAANGRAFGSFDNVRLPGVAGRDREVIPDGQLCSATLPEWRGLDIPRTDWPDTRLAAGGPLTISYQATIAHRGTFRVYLTRTGYDPRQPLRWADLDDAPLLTVTDPPLVNGAYQLAGGLPGDRLGPHLLYTIWQNSDTPDTYYSCSDVLLVATSAAAAVSPAPSPTPGVAVESPGAVPSAGPAPRSAAPARSAAPRTAIGPVRPRVAATSAAPVVPPPPPPGEGGTSTAQERWLGRAEPASWAQVAMGQLLVSVALLMLAGVSAAIGLVRLRRGRRPGAHLRPGRR